MGGIKERGEEERDHIPNITGAEGGGGEGEIWVQYFIWLLKWFTHFISPLGGSLREVEEGSVISFFHINDLDCKDRNFPLVTVIQ